MGVVFPAAIPYCTLFLRCQLGALGDGGGGEGEASTWRSGEEEGRTVGERDQRVLEKAARPEDSAGAK